VTRLLLIRHAESVWNAEKRWQGRADPPLSETGRNEAARAADALRGQVDLAFASPQVRAYETARIIASALGLPDVETDEALCEVDVGEFSGLTIEEVEAKFPEELAAWRSRDLDVTAPGGESRREMLERVRPALLRIAATHSGSRVLVVTHGGVIGSLERSLDAEAGPAHHVSGRWFDVDGDEITAIGERISLIGDRHAGAPEAR
jgi:broad specificity phosphatase PhoE